MPCRDLNDGVIFVKATPLYTGVSNKSIFNVSARQLGLHQGAMVARKELVECTHY
jgi:hypothetical protein